MFTILFIIRSNCVSYDIINTDPLYYSRTV